MDIVRFRVLCGKVGEWSLTVRDWYLQRKGLRRADDSVVVCGGISGDRTMNYQGLCSLLLEPCPRKPEFVRMLEGRRSREFPKHMDQGIVAV